MTPIFVTTTHSLQLTWLTSTSITITFNSWCKHHLRSQLLQPFLFSLSDRHMDWIKIALITLKGVWIERVNFENNLTMLRIDSTWPLACDCKTDARLFKIELDQYEAVLLEHLLTLDRWYAASSWNITVHRLSFVHKHAALLCFAPHAWPGCHTCGFCSIVLLCHVVGSSSYSDDLVDGSASGVIKRNPIFAFTGFCYSGRPEFSIILMNNMKCLHSLSALVQYSSSYSQT
jgi:hypothetical protein